LADIEGGSSWMFMYSWMSMPLWFLRGSGELSAAWGSGLAKENSALMMIDVASAVSIRYLMLSRANTEERYNEEMVSLRFFERIT